MPENESKLNPIYLIFMYTEDLALICNGWYTIKPNQTNVMIRSVMISKID